MFRVARVTHRNALTRTSCATEFRTARTAPTRRMLAVSSKLALFYLTRVWIYLDIVLLEKYLNFFKFKKSTAVL